MSNLEEAARIAASDATVSDKIRALDAAGHPRAEIARLLGKRYQHVRNVLEGDKVGRPTARVTGVAEESAPFRGAKAAKSALRLEITSEGSVVLPAAVIESLGLYPGGVVISELEAHGLVLLSHDEVIRRMRASIPQWSPGEPLESEELIAERRREAAQEEEEAIRYGAKPLD